MKKEEADLADQYLVVCGWELVLVFHCVLIKKAGIGASVSFCVD